MCSLDCESVEPLAAMTAIYKLFDGRRFAAWQRRSDSRLDAFAASLGYTSSPDPKNNEGMPGAPVPGPPLSQDGMAPLTREERASARLEGI